MRAYLWIATVLFGGCTVAFPSANAGSAPERELRSVESARNNALRTGDTTVLAQLYADDFVMITSSGQLRTKRDQLRDIASGSVQHQGPSERILHLTLRGDVAIVQSESDAGTLVIGGQADTRMRRYTRVYVRHAGRWQLLATHISVVPDSMLGPPCPPNPRSAFGQARSPIVDSIAHLDSAWARSYAVHDTALAMALFAPEVLIVGGNGSMKSREREMQDIRPQQGLRMHFFSTSNVIIECYASACAVVGVAEWEFEYNGRVDRTRRRYSATWVRGGSLGWQMVSLHISQALAP